MKHISQFEASDTHKLELAAQGCWNLLEISVEVADGEVKGF